MLKLKLNMNILYEKKQQRNFNYLVLSVIWHYQGIFIVVNPPGEPGVLGYKVIAVIPRKNGVAVNI